MQNMLENFDTSWIGNFITAAVAGAVGWLTGRRKQTAEAASSELDNTEKAIAIWRSIASDMEGRFSSLQKEVIELRNEVLKLQLQNHKLRSDNEGLKQNNAELQAEIDDIRNQLKSK
jgi:peptidoglycan hydrolase CwlO-like protein